MSSTPAYDHIQRGRIHVLLHFLVLPMVGVALTLDPVWVALPLAVGAVFELLALSFHRLRVRDRGDHLAISFGPLPVFRKQVPYSEMVGVAQARSSLIEGWGIHFLPMKGWIWNIHGRDCARIELSGGRTLKVGTDDPEGLVGFLAGRLSA